MSGSSPRRVLVTSKALLQAVDAVAAALVHEGELLTAGEVPSSHDTRRIAEWLEEHYPRDAVLLGPDAVSPTSVEDLAALLGGEAELRSMLHLLRSERRAWAGELTLQRADGHSIPLAVRGEPVPGESGDDLGCVLFATDMRAQRDAEATRRRVHEVMLDAQRQARTGPGAIDPDTARDFGEVIDTILSNARRALSNGAGTAANPHPATMASVEALTRRAAALALQLEGYTAARRQRATD